MSKIKKIGLAGVVLAIVFVLVFICFNRKEQNKIDEKKTENPVMNLYPYANSTDIYSSNARYALDGTKKSELPHMLGLSNDMDIIYVNDKWLYYCEYNTDKGDLLRRIPLHKGKNHRDIVDESKAEIVRNTYNENGFTVNDNYYAGISYGTVVMLMNLETKHTVRKKVPAQIAYPKKADTEAKVWTAWEQDKNWILWVGECGTMIQMIPSGDIYLLETKRILGARKGENCIYYTTDSKSCYQYDFLKKKKRLCLNQDDIHKLINGQLDLTNAEKKTYKINSILSDKSKVYWQVEAKYSIKEEMKKKYVILTYDEKGKQFTVDETLTKVLEKRQASRFIMHICSKWYLFDGDFLCYDETTKKVKKIDVNTPEWNMSYACTRLGIGEYKFF